jgi:uncharacterized protein (DUF1330 family)
MAAYVIAHLREIQENPEMLDYRGRVPATLDQYGGRFIVRGGPVEVREGEWPADRLVIIEFPSADDARRWYESAEYQGILPMRTGNAECDVVIAEGLP